MEVGFGLQGGREQVACDAKVVDKQRDGAFVGDSVCHASVVLASAEELHDGMVQRDRGLNWEKTIGFVRFVAKYIRFKMW